MAMVTLIGRRLLQLVPVAFGVTLAAFFLLRIIPGDPAVAILGTRATPELIGCVMEEYGLDLPITEQFVIFLGHLARGDLGYSYVQGQPVAQLVAEQIPPTLALVAYATALAALIAVPLALWAALRRGSIADHAIRAAAMLGVGLPGYWLGIVLLLLFAIAIPLFPVGGYGEDAVDHLRHLFLPALTLAAGVAPVVLRALRESLVEALGSPHVAVARAKGLPEPAVVLKHVLYNALIPAVTLLGLNAGWLVGGTLIVESIFGVPGLGMLLFRGIGARDYPTVQAVIMALAVLTVLIQLVTDVARLLLDPRARASAASAAGAG